MDWQEKLARQQACRPSHARKVDGVWLQGSNDVYRALIMGNGVLQIRVSCGTCEESCGFLPRDVWRRWVAAGAVLTMPMQVNKPGTVEPCSYTGCTNLPTEYHHFAPYNTFGPDAENWPCAYLCREHHQHWHRTMTGYSWHARRSA